MAHDSEFGVDIESGRSETENGGSVNVEDQASLCGSLVNSDVDSVDSVVIDMKMEDLDSGERKVVKEKCKKMSNKKASKPPRPPRGPSLDAGDEKLIREFAELVMWKRRIRTERVKALKKTRAAKPSSSSSSSLFAMIFTTVFCFVILLQGITTRSDSHIIIDGSPNSSAPKSDLISTQCGLIASAADSKMPASGSPSLLELASGQGINEGAKTVSA